MTKAQAIAEVKSKGYTNHIDTGCSGDYGYGSRLYFTKPGIRFSDPSTPASVSKLPGGWYTSYPGEGT